MCDTRFCTERKMAVRSSRNSVKRSEYVYDDDSTWDGYSSSDNEQNNTEHRQNKVRSEKSIRSLLKESSIWQKSDEHAYTQAPERTCRGKRSRRDTESDANSLRSSKKARCENRNAINARINRERKKAYLHSLEDEVEKLKELNKDYSVKVVDQEATIGDLKEEVLRLKSLLANNKFLSSLVSTLGQVTGLPVSSSLLSKVRQQDGCNPNPNPRIRSVPLGLNHPIARSDVNLGSVDMDELSPSISDDTESLFPSLDSADFDFDTDQFLPLDYSDPTDFPEKNVGICVHINQNRLSVEFCPVCNARAMSA